MMRRGIILLAIPALLAGCGGDGGALTCDDGPYQAAVRTPKVESPDGLDSLDPLNEMPLPEASPQNPRPQDGPCLEQPPQIMRIE